jgi:3-oxoacyl-[acyl-carrier protein] reductase/pteridine reductase
MGKTILITGAGKRIGAALAKYFGLKGYNIVVHYNTSEKSASEVVETIRSSKGSAISYCADLRIAEQVHTLFDFALQQYGKIDVLINNAGVFPNKTTLQDMRLDEWNDVFNTNLTACLLTAQEFSRQSNLNDARIINIASIGGLQRWKYRIAYNVSKNGVIALTKSLAKELAPAVSVNCICPGIVQLEENEKMAISRDKIPMLEYATIGDICGAMDFFVDGSHYITGQILSVDGGMSL